MKKESLTVNGERVTVWIGSAPGPAVVLCHGNSASSRSFSRQLDGALARRFRIIALDWPGHGESPDAIQADRTYTLPGYAALLVGAMEALGVSEVVYVGWSLGGHVILEASDRLPGLAGIMLFGAPPVGFPPASDSFLPNPALGVAFQADCSDGDGEAFVSAFFREGTPIPDAFREDFRRTDPRVRTNLGGSLSSGGFRDEVEVVAALKRPLAVLHGRYDQLVNRSYLDGLTIPTLWRSSVQEVPDAGHTPQWEQPTAFDQLLAAFVHDCVKGCD